MKFIRQAGWVMKMNKIEATLRCVALDWPVFSYTPRPDVRMCTGAIAELVSASQLKGLSINIAFEIATAMTGDEPTIAVQGH